MQSQSSTIPTGPTGRNQTLGNFDRTSEIIKLSKQGLSQRQIGERVGMAKGTVGKRLRAAGKGRPPNVERYSHIATSEIIKLSEQGLSQRQIGKQLRMGKGAVGNRLRREGKVRAPARVTDAQLKECRLDPAWEARQGIKNRIVCRVCGELKAILVHAHGHLRKHRMTAADYASKYPGARVTNFGIAADQAKRQGRPTTLQQLMEAFAARFLTADELKKCRRDPAWEEHHEVKVFVVCRVCGLKNRTDLYLHLRGQHGLSSKDYRARFPKAALIPLALKVGPKRAYSRDRGRRQRELLAKAVRVLAEQAQQSKKKPGPAKLAKEKRQYFKVGQLIEAKLAEGVNDGDRDQLTTARLAIAKQLDISYASAARYHKQFRKAGGRDRVNPIPAG